MCDLNPRPCSLSLSEKSFQLDCLVECVWCEQGCRGPHLAYRLHCTDNGKELLLCKPCMQSKTKFCGLCSNPDGKIIYHSNKFE